MSESKAEDSFLEKPEARYSQNKDEAIKKFETFREIDPFPAVEPALLNSADICDYVAATGMIHPFYEKDDFLKPASYEVAVLGKLVWWDDKDRKHVENIIRGKEFLLRRNSITFITLEPTFHIPQYIALRFNLKITHIYRGILLGTGPLVDPGFTGRLSIPLHNLTTNDYRLVGGDSLIWMEFTKLSRRREWTPAKAVTAPRQGRFYDLKTDKQSFGDVEDYLRKADPLRSIRSSISDALQTAVRQVKAASRTNRVFAGISVVAILVAVIAIVSYFSATNSYLRKAQDDVQAMRLELENEKKKTEHLEAQMAILQSQIKAQSRDTTTNSGK